MGVNERVLEVVTPVVAELGVELVDVEVAGGLVRVFIDEPGGIGSERLTSVTRAVSQALDEEDPIAGHYVLEVSSPGLERPLRTPAHFAAAIGQKVSIKTLPGTVDIGRRLTGVISGADETGVTLLYEVDGRPKGMVHVQYPQIDKAKTIFEWGPSPKPGSGSRPGRTKGPKAGERGDKPERTGKAVDGRNGAKPTKNDSDSGGGKADRPKGDPRGKRALRAADLPQRSAAEDRYQADLTDVSSTADQFDRSAAGAAPGPGATTPLPAGQMENDDE